MPSSQSFRSAAVWLVVILILAVTLWFGWKALRDARPQGATAGPGGGRPPSAVITRPVERKTVVETLSVTGTLRAVRRAEVAARESAAVDELLIDEGDLVKKGAILAKLDPRRLKAQIQEASADLTSASADLAQRQAERERAVRDEEMMRGLWEQRAVAEREYLDSVRGMKVAEARANAAGEMIEAARKRLDLLEVREGDLDVRAPFNGRVVARHTEVGEWLSEGSPVATLVSSDEAEAWLQLPERHARLLRQTSPENIEIKVTGIDVPIRADKLTVIPEIGGRSRRFTVVAHLPDPENHLTTGASVRASVPLGEPVPRLVVPSDAVLVSYAGSHVFVPQPGGDGPPLAKRIDVEVLFERAGEAILADGALNEGDPVIVEGNERLFPGTPLAPQPSKPDAAGGERPAQAAGNR